MNGATIIDNLRLPSDSVCERREIRTVKNLDQPLFTLSQIVRAINGNAATIYSWFDRGHFALGKKDQQAEIGGGHALSFRTALEVAIAVELYRRCKLHPAIGAKVAREFTRYGADDRDPGELFEKDFTVLVAYPETESAKVVKMTNKTPMFDAFLEPNQGRVIGSTLLFLNYIDRDLRVALLQDGKGTKR